MKVLSRASPRSD